MKRAILIFLLIISFTLIYGQEHDIIWENSFGGSEVDSPESGCLAIDGTYVFAGSTFSNNGDVSGNHGDRDLWLINVDNTGNLIWQKCIGGGSSDRIYSINNTTDGGYIAAGRSNTSLETDMWIIKLDLNGIIEWERILGGSNFDGANCAIQTIDGGYICIGTSRSIDGDVSISLGNDDCWIVKLNELGNIEWEKTFGGSNNDSGESIIELMDGSFVFVANSKSDDIYVGFNNGLSDVWIVHIDHLGNIIWEKNYGGSGADFVREIVPSNNGGYTIGAGSWSNDGDVTGGHGDYDMWILEIDEDGELIWAKCYGGTESDQPHSLIKTSSGGNVIVGRTGSNDGNVSGNHGNFDSWVIETDQDGNLLWQQCYGGGDFEDARKIFRNLNGNYIIPSWSKSIGGDVSGNHGELDFWVFEIEGHEYVNPVIPIGSAGIVIAVLLIVGVFIVRRHRVALNEG